MEKAVSEIEAQRLDLQEALDAKKDLPIRNRMGQFATPTGLALDIQRYAKAFLSNHQIVRFLDPAIGTGSFYSALLEVFSQSQIGTAVGYEIDPHYGKPAAKLWNETDLDLRLDDFTQAKSPDYAEKYNLLICNPPYVRHHHIPTDEKQRLKLQARDASGVEVNGLAGLYCYFLCLCHRWMAEGCIAGWLIPSEFMDVNYGTSVKHYLLSKVTLLHIHRFDPNDVQFSDALTSSAVVWIRNESPRNGHKVRFTFGGTLQNPKLDRIVPVEVLRRSRKWTQYPMNQACQTAYGPVLSDFFAIKRGLVTGNNNFFILSEHEIRRRELPIEAFKPILPSPRYLPDDIITDDQNGNPMLEHRLFLLDPPWRENEIKDRYPSLWEYLEEGKAKGVADSYICRHRTLWYAQENRPPAPFVCTYLGRSDKKNGRPFRFILNDSQATAANVYLMLYPKEPIDCVLRDSPDQKRKVWEHLNKISPHLLLGEGRVYGGGLHKLEPKELGNVPVESLAEILPNLAWTPRAEQLELFSDSAA